MQLTPRTSFSLFAASVMLLLPACSSPKVETHASAIGQRVQVGKLFYQVLEAQWQTELPGAKDPPKNRILQLRLAVTNSAGSDIPVPFLRLLDANGKAHMEVAEIEGNPKWMGAFRRLEPTLTEDGLIYFDVPVGAYNLEVVDTSDTEKDLTALIAIPASLAPPPSTGTDPSKGQ